MNYRVAIIGATSGIGKASALLLSQHNFELILVGRNESALIETSVECMALGAKAAIPVPCDIRDPNECVRIGNAMSDAALPERFGLINAAGISSFWPSTSFDLAATQKIVETNLLGTIYATQACLPELLSRPGSVVATIHSIAAVSALPDASVYGATKAGTLQYCRSLRAELRSKGLIVSDLILGATNTPIWDHVQGEFNRNDMIPCELAAEHLANLIQQNPRASIDEIHVLPPKGVL